jgi:hypothetical protein
MSELDGIDGYLARLPADRRDAIATVRAVINDHLPMGYEERVQYGMIAWVVPASVLPAAQVYNKQPLAYVALASQKSHMAVYMMGIYGDDKLRAWFEKAYKATGKKFDVGKSCVRFKSLDALPLEVLGDAVSRISVQKFVDSYHAIRATTKTAKTAKTTKTAKVTRAKKATPTPPQSRRRTVARARPSTASRSTRR